MKFKELKERYAEQKAWAKQHGWFYPKTLEEAHMQILYAVCWGWSTLFALLAFASVRTYEKGGSDGELLFAGFCEGLFIVLLIMSYRYLLKEQRLARTRRANSRRLNVNDNQKAAEPTKVETLQQPGPEPWNVP